MFNETSYKLDWQGRQSTRPQMIASGDTGGIDTVYAPGYGPPAVESPGFMAPDYSHRYNRQPANGPQNPAPADASAPGAGGFMDSLTSLPWWVYAGAAYFLFFRKGRR